MALYIPHSIFHLARLLYVSPETFGPYYVYETIKAFVSARFQASAAKWLRTALFWVTSQ